MRARLDKLIAAWRGSPWWKKILIGLAIACVAIGVAAVAVFLSKPRTPKDAPAIRVAKERGELIDGLVERNEARAAELREEREEAREEREAIEERIENSGEGRNDFHEEIDRAAARGDIASIREARERRRRQGRSDN